MDREMTVAATSAVARQFCPVVDRHRFAEMVGVSVGVVEGWINRGQIPVRRIGRRVLVDLVALGGAA